MDIKDILLFLRAAAPAPAALQVATQLAHDHRAFVQACCLMEEPPLEPADCYAIGPTAVGEVLDRRSQALRTLSEPSRQAFQDVLACAGSGGVWTLATPDEAADISALRARFADLVILGRAASTREPDRRLAEALVLLGGAPCLLLPESDATPNGFGRIVVAWNRSQQAKRALDDGLALLKSAAAVQVVTVDETDAEPDDLGVDVVLARLAHHGIRAEARRLKRHGDVAKALLGACHAFGADLLVLGAYGHGRVAEAVLGGVTRTLLARAPLPILMSH
jgi:nucleotide-binding universal stress UspA family protein